MYAMGALHYLSVDETTGPALLRSGAVEAALGLLTPAPGAAPPHPLVLEHATGLLMNLAQCPDLRRPLAGLGCIAVLVQQLSAPKGTATSRYRATVAVNYLCFQDPDHKSKVVEAGGVERVLQTLGAAQCTPQHCEALCATLQSISVEEEHGPVVVGHGGVEALMGLLGSPAATPQAREYVLGALQNVAGAPAALDVILAQDGVGRMVRVLRDPAATPGARNAAAGVLLSVSLDEGLCDALATPDAALALVEVARACVGAGTSELLDDVLATLQNLSIADPGRNVLVACEAIPVLAAVVEDRAPHAATKECAVWALLNACLDSPANRRRVAATGVMPALRAFGTSYAQDDDLRNQILQFGAEVDAATQTAVQCDVTDLQAADDGAHLERQVSTGRRRGSKSSHKHDSVPVVSVPEGVRVVKSS